MCRLLGRGGRRGLGVCGRPVCVVCVEYMYDIVGAQKMDISSIKIRLT